MPLNKELLLKVKQHILEEPKRFVMDYWVVRREQGGRNFFYGDNEQPREFASCNTAACIAGWVCLLGQDPENPISSNFSTNACRLLGLNEEATYLFYTERWPSDFEERYDSETDLTKKAQIAAERIDFFIENQL